MNLANKLCLTVLIATLVSNSAQYAIDPTSDRVQFGGLSHLKPGLKVRMTQAFSELLKNDLLQYGVSYINWDLNIPREGNIHLQSWPLSVDMFYNKLRYEPFKVDFTEAALNYTHMVMDDAAVVYLKLPVIEHWAAAFDYSLNGPITINNFGAMQMEFRDLTAIVTSQLYATHDGHIFPHLHNLKINVEQSYLYHKNPILQFVYRQFFDLGKYLLQSSYNMFGANLLNKNLYDITKSYTNSQVQNFTLGYDQLGKDGNFTMNWRMTADPQIHDHELDFSFLFEIAPEGHRCLVPADQHNYYFQNNYKNKYMQFVMSDRVPNCFMEALERQEWFDYNIDSQWMIDHMNTHRVKINAALFKKSLPQIASKYGDDQELEIELQMRSPRVTFGLTDNDMEFTSFLKFGIRIAGQKNYIFFDEFQFYLRGDMAIDQEVFIANVAELRVEKSELSDQDRDKPVYNTLDMDAAQYSEFWNSVNRAADTSIRWVNNYVLATGIPLPYWNLEFLTGFTFHRHAMLVVLDVFYNNMELIL